MILGSPILSRIKITIFKGRAVIYIPKEMVDELDMKKGDYVIPSFLPRDDKIDDELFGNNKLIFAYYRNKSGKKFNPALELESDRDV